MYSVTKLCQLSNISQQTFYRLIRENSEFRALIECNREKHTNNSYGYSETVLEWLRNYRGTTQEAPQEQEKTQSTDPKATPAPETPSATERDLLAKIASLESEIERLNAALDEKEQERKTLFASNANLLLLLTQEKQEKQALLPPPRPDRHSFAQRLKALFTGKET